MRGSDNSGQQRSNLMSFQKSSQSVLSLEGDSDLTSDPYWNIANRRNDGGSAIASGQSSKRRKQNLSSYARSQPQSQNIFDADPFEAVMSDGMDASSSEWTGLSLAADRGQISPAKAPPGGQGAEIRHLDITIEDPFGNRDKSEEKTKKSKKNNGKMKSTFDDISLDELRRYRRLSGNTLWSLVQKRKMGLGSTTTGEESTSPGVAAGSSASTTQNSGSSANSGGGPGGSSITGSTGNDKAMNKRLQQLWGCLPEKERRVWKSKAKRIMKQLQGIQKREASQAAAGKLIPPEVVRQKEKQRIANRLSALKMTTFNTGDLAAHIKLVGDGLFSIGQNLKNQSGPVAVDGVESILLDSLVCAFPPLLALCNQVCGLDDVIPTEEICETLDSVAYLMPGLY